MTTVQTVGTGARDHADLTEIDAYLDTEAPISVDYRFDFYNDGEITEASAVTFNDYGQDATNNITLQPEGMNAAGTNVSNEGFDGKRDFSSAALDYDAAAGSGVGIAYTATTTTTFPLHFIVQGLQIKATADYSGRLAFTGDGIKARRNIFRDETKTASFMALTSDVDEFINNAFIYSQSKDNTSGYSIQCVFGTQDTIKIVNNTIVTGSASVDDLALLKWAYDGGLFAQNLLLRTGGTATAGIYIKQGSNTVTGDYNVLNSTTHDTLPGSNNDDTATASDEIVDASVAGETEAVDLRLKSGATSEGFIPDGSEDAGTPIVDIRGQTRVGVDVDAGCFQLTVAAGGGRIMSSLAGSGGLAGMGGIAGQGGGLAG